ncbi:hypothetical protein HAX54_006937, partial [Datura stramonium]|nr:hypothetical protein [Datura stramonium]
RASKFTVRVRIWSVSRRQNGVLSSMTWSLDLQNSHISSDLRDSSVSRSISSAMSSMPQR